MPTIRLMPAGSGKMTTTTVNGRTYSAALGATIDVPDFDAFQLMHNGWVEVALGGVGATAARPAKPTNKMQFHDTTLGKNIVWEGSAWRDPATGSAV